MKIVRHYIFLLTALLFVFTYPKQINTWTLNDSIGWHSYVGRPLISYFWPIGFVLIFYMYQVLDKRKNNTSNQFFWTHVFITLVPIFFINSPFSLSVLEQYQLSENLWTAIMILDWSLLVYLIIQLIYFCLLIYKLRKTLVRR